jgi:hypothetical protein
MKLTVAAENPIERLILALGVAPVTLMDTHMSFMRAIIIVLFVASARALLPPPWPRQNLCIYFNKSAVLNSGKQIRRHHRNLCFYAVTK